LGVPATTSGSDAWRVKPSVLPTPTAWLPGSVRLGAVLTSLTVTVSVFVALRLGAPLSVTRTVMLKVPSCVSVGVQLNTPLGALIVAPGGAPGSRLKLSVLAGRSGSVAVAVKV